MNEQNFSQARSDHRQDDVPCLSYPDHLRGRSSQPEYGSRPPSTDGLWTRFLVRDMPLRQARHRLEYGSLSRHGTMRTASAPVQIAFADCARQTPQERADQIKRSHAVAVRDSATLMRDN